MLNNKTHYSNDARLINPLSLLFDLPTIIENMKHSHSWTKGEMNTMILLKHPDKQVILALAHEKTKINSFQSNGSVTIQIVEGKIKFRTSKDSVIVQKGQSVKLINNEKYKVVTKEKTVFLITISNDYLIPSKKHTLQLSVKTYNNSDIHSDYVMSDEYLSE